MRLAAILILFLSLAMSADAQLLTTGVGSGAFSNGPPPSCTADGKTDWSNACDIPMGVALGVL